GIAGNRQAGAVAQEERGRALPGPAVGPAVGIAIRVASIRAGVQMEAVRVTELHLIGSSNAANLRGPVTRLIGGLRIIIDAAKIDDYGRIDDCRFLVDRNRRRTTVIIGRIAVI